MRIYAGVEDEWGDYTKARILLQSIPYDGTSTWGKGADQGFESFLDATDNMELYDIETDSEVYKQGVHILDPIREDSSPEAVFETVYKKTQELLKTGKYLSFFGGEHSISIGVIKAFYEHHDNLSVLQIDAHADLRPDYHGSPYNHACAVYDASQNCNLVQVGIRSMDADEKQYVQEGNCFYAHEMWGHDRWMDESIARLTDKVYLTIDLDAFDPSILAATGTPEPGGMGWYETLKYLRRVFREKEVVGFDIVELAPEKAHKASNFLAAKLYYKLLSYQFEDGK
ncbi:agmatinase [Croceimicrobium sp.]|uniref:agmatinase n=1 Tax=Croceimicrobium sp. TaxID=2828340 RepID=UPI003BA97B19